MIDPIKFAKNKLARLSASPKSTETAIVESGEFLAQVERLQASKSKNIFRGVSDLRQKSKAQPVSEAPQNVANDPTPPSLEAFLRDGKPAKHGVSTQMQLLDLCRNEILTLRARKPTAAASAPPAVNAQAIAAALLDEQARREAAAKIKTRAQFSALTPREKNEYIRNGGKLVD